MSNSKISVQVHGGTSTIGNIVQGDRSRASATLRVRNPAEARIFESFFSNIGQYITGEASKDREVAELMRSIEDLRAKITLPDQPHPQSIGKIAKNIYETYGWAAKPLKELFDAIAPDWISQLPPQFPSNI